MDRHQATLYHQKRVVAHRPDWPRLLSRRFYLTPLNDPVLQGYHSLMCMDAVRAPLIRSMNGKETTLIDQGYAWLQYYLTGSDFSAVATFDQKGQLVQWYLDVISIMGVNVEGYPWYDDLYLDVVATPDGWVEIIDGTDLDAALKNGAIDQPMYDQAWRTAERLTDELRRETFLLNQKVHRDWKYLLEQAPLLIGNW